MDRPGQAAHGFSLTPTPHTLPWPGDGPGLAGVSSFGGGIFVHVILGAPPRRARAADPERPDAYLLPLSARDPGALRRLAGAYAGVLAAEPAPDPLDVCFTAGARRTHHDHRMAVVGAGRAELVAALREGPAAHPEPPAAGAVRAAARPRVVFVFPGQGAHWVGMGRGLLRSSPVFARWIRECGRAVRDELGWSPADRLESGGPLSAVDEVQPTVWAVQVALAEVWRHWGIAPDMVIGHSMGEIAAATVAGALTIGDGAAVVCRRGRLLRERAVPGAMWAVRLTEREAQEAIGEHAGQVCAGVLNSRTSTVLSGDPGALAKVTEPLLARGVFCRRVKVDYASHAPQVEPMRAGLLAALADVRPRPAVVPMHSTAWSRPVDGPELGAAYWMENLRRPVRFGAAVRSVLAGGTPTVFVEVSAHPLLIKPVEEAIEEATATAAVVGSLYRRCPDLETLLAGLGAAYAAGCDPDWSRLHTGGRLVSLPGYPWARTDLGRAEAVSTP
jgi:acyl transferase domain-containing protein